MRVLFLGKDDSAILGHLRRVEEQVTATEDLITVSDADFIVSHGYRHILKGPLLEAFDGRAINLHIAYLPWNRGADPNLWSFLDDSPKGVTIHCIDAGLDTGDILAQELVAMTDEMTLAESYAALQGAMLNLFVKHWPELRCGSCKRYKMPLGGTYHRSRDKEAFSHLLSEGWGTKCASLRPSSRRTAQTSRT